MSQTVNIHPALRGPVALSHLFLHRFVSPGDTTIDATCGNGHDTALLAALVGDTGKVVAFDTQGKAIEMTRQKLIESAFENRVTLIHDGHERMSEYGFDGVSAIVFNLGYLPAGDHTVVTTVETTISALRQAQQLLKKGGVIALTLYPGHDGGDREKDAVEAFAGALSPRAWHVWQMRQLNVSSTAPLFLLIQKVS